VPEERWESVVFWLGIGAVVALVALIVVGGSAKAPIGRAEAAEPTPTATVVAPTPPPTQPTVTAKPKPRPAPAAVTLRLTARNDTWLSVRTSSGHTVLYEGTLPAGAARTFSGTSFDVRFGAAANVEATLNGKPLRLPGGTYSVTIRRAGLGPRTA
jgi:hypothetical protein